MTTIAFREGIMAADSQETGGIKSMCRKLFIKKNLEGNRCIIGTAGGSFSGMIYIDHFGTKKERPTTIDFMDIDEDFHNLIWDGKALWEVNWLWRPIRVPNSHKYFAIGSGAAAALGAMAMGASAEGAVRIAKTIDNYTGGPIVTRTLKPNWEK